MNFLINDYTGDIEWDRLIFPINMTFLVLAFLILFFLKGNTVRKKLRKRFLVMLLFFLNLVVCACFYDSDGDDVGIGAFFYFTPILISLVISFFCWLVSLLKILVVSKKAYWHKGFLYRKESLLKSKIKLWL